MAKKQTKFGTFEGELYYARLHEANMDDSEYHEKTQGQFNTIFIPKDNEELQRMIDLGYPETSMGNKMIKEYSYADNRLGVKLKRPNVHPSGIEDFGGAPKVTQGKSNMPWDFIAEGELGNGTKAAVKISIYGEGSTASVRLEKVGIIEHVPYEERSLEDAW